MNELHTTIVQYDIIWHDPEANIAKINMLLSEIDDTDVIVLPEMWSTGFSMQAEQVAVPMDHYTIHQMRAWAKQYDALVLGSLSIVEDGKYFNRMIAAAPDGTQWVYDKRHLFSLANEHLSYTAGQEHMIVDYKTWQIALYICYDLRFPVWSRNTQAYDIAVYVANWPSKRHSAWATLTKARAIENQCYVLGANRVGTDNNGHQYQGGSVICNFDGEILSDLSLGKEGLLDARLKKSEIIQFREKLPFLEDRY